MVAHAYGIRSEVAFTAGLLSCLEQVLHAPMSAILGQLTLSDELLLGIEQRRGPVGRLLEDVDAYESGGVGGPEGSSLSQAYLGAVAWTNATLALLGQKP